MGGRPALGSRLTVQVGHGSAEGEPHSFVTAGGASLRHLGSVEPLVDPHSSHLGSRKPSPEERKDGGQCDGRRLIGELVNPETFD